MDHRSTVKNLTGGGGHRCPCMRWAWVVPWIILARSMSLPPYRAKKPWSMSYQATFIWKLFLAQRFCTSKHQGADGGRGSRTFEAPRCRCYLMMPHHRMDSTRRSVGITLQGGTRNLSAAVATPTTCGLGGQRPLLRVGNRATDGCATSSPDSDLEVFSHNPTHGSFVPLAFEPSAMTNLIGRADIEGSKSSIAINAWLPQARCATPAKLST
ncbi:hypothetical protein GOBAR_DD00044 [Gossypium barbadense]|nr:hypothetical protein GOBAR_DD00044 [Gossypium barbadense]